MKIFVTSLFATVLSLNLACVHNKVTTAAKPIDPAALATISKGIDEFHDVPNVHFHGEAGKRKTPSIIPSHSALPKDPYTLLAKLVERKTFADEWVVATLGTVYGEGPGVSLTDHAFLVNKSGNFEIILNDGRGYRNIQQDPHATLLVRFQSDGAMLKVFGTVKKADENARKARWKHSDFKPYFAQGGVSRKIMLSNGIESNEQCIQKTLSDDNVAEHFHVYELVPTKIYFYQVGSQACNSIAADYQLNKDGDWEIGYLTP